MAAQAKPSARPARRNYRLGELFVGAGGMALGAHKAKIKGHGFTLAWANDMNPDACLTLQNNLPYPRGRVICSPVEKLNFKKLPPVDGLAFGFPCNDFSLVGDRKGISGHYGGLYVWSVKALRALRPAFFVAENVSGLSSSGDREDFKTITAALRRAGYDLFDNLYKFEEYGIPQRRHRMVIVGFRKDLEVEFRIPRPGGKRMNCADALAGIPATAENHEFAKQSETVIERLKHIRAGENAFNAKLPPSLQLNLKSGATISQIYRRLSPNQPAYTVTGSGGGGTHLYHWKENRSLTNRERARLQTFPDSFVFCGSKESVRRQVGMAVPPKGAEIIFRAVLRALFRHGVAPARSSAS